jgi:hypothetical protein
MSDQFKNVRIRKVRITTEEIEIDHEDSSSGMTGNIKSPLNEKHISNEPAPEFRIALGELAGPVAEICEFDKAEISRLKITGVSLDYKGEEGKKVMGAVITASRQLAMSKLCMTINTPHLPEIPYGKNPEGNRLPDKAVSQINLIINQARKYLSGARAQKSLFEKEDDK